MAKFKTVVQNLDDVDATQHDYYKETKIGNNTVYVLDIEGVDDHPSVLALKNALERQKEERRKATEELATLKKRVETLPEDFDPEKYQELLAELEELKNNPNRKPDEKERQELATARKSLEQKIARMEKEHGEALKKKDVEIEKQKGKISSLLVDDGLTKALVEAGVGKEYLKAAKALLKGECIVTEEDGDYRAVVKSDLGDMEIGRFVSDWVSSDEGKVFVPVAKGGDSSNSNGRPTKPTNSEKNPWSQESWNLTEQGKILKEDRARAEKLAKAAGKKLAPAA